MTLPICPKCGSRARIVRIKKTSIRCELNNDGSIGRVLSKALGGVVEGYECAGAHKWPAGKDDAIVDSEEG